jgi:DNA-binding MarR family transcriptional regulator
MISMAAAKKKSPAGKAKVGRPPGKAKVGRPPGRAKAAEPAAAKARIAARPAAKTTARARKAPAAKRAVAPTKAAAPKKAPPARKAPARKAAESRAPAKHEGTASRLMTLASRLVVRALSARLGPKGIGYGQYPVLLHLWEEDGLTQKELSNRVRIEAPTMVRTLDRMEREKLVTRKRSDADRRQIHIELTAKGKALESELASLSDEVDKLALAGLKRKDRDQLRELVGRIIKNLESDAASA